MNRRARSILAGLMVLALVSLACVISIPNNTSIDSAATSVAGTVNALAGTAESLITAMPHNLTETPDETLPTLPPAAEVSPLQVSFVPPDGSLYTWAEGMAAPIMLIGPDNICCSFVSPDGSMIAFSRFIDYQFASLEVINTDGTNRHTLLDSVSIAAIPRPEGAVGTEPSQVVWIPGRQTLAVQMRNTFEGPGLFNNSNLFLIDAISGDRSTLLNTGANTWQMIWSPDGSKVAISNPEGISTYSSDGALIDDSVLVYPFVRTASEYAWTAYPIWSTNNSTLMVRVPPVDPFFGSGVESYSSIWQVEADGLSGEMVFQGPMHYQMQGDSGIAPDLSRMAYLAPLDPPSGNTYNLVVSSVDGSGSVVVETGQFQVSPVWATDSAHYFYGLGLLPASTPYIGQVGAAPTAVLDYSNPVEVQWVDATRYLVVTNNDGRWQLLLGTIGESTGLIYDSVSPSAYQLTFSVNR